MYVKLRITEKGKMSLGNGYRYAWKVRIEIYHVFINSKFRNAGYAWKVRIMGKVKWM